MYSSVICMRKVKNTWHSKLKTCFPTIIEGRRKLNGVIAPEEAAQFCGFDFFSLTFNRLKMNPMLLQVLVPGLALHG